jgi:predicted MFS family arabinose efflux permease
MRTRPRRRVAFRLSHGLIPGALAGPPVSWGAVTPPAARVPTPLPSRGRTSGLLRPVLLALGTASALGLARFAYGLLVPAMRAELGWSLAKAGTLTTANSLGYLVGALAAGPLARRLTETATFRLGMVLTAAALAANAATSSYPVLLATRAAAGVSGALVFIAGGVLASRAAASRGSALPVSIYFAGAGIGVAVSGTVIPPLLSHHPDRWPLAWAGLAAAAGLAAIFSWTAAADGAAGTEGGAGGVAGTGGGAGGAGEGGLGGANRGGTDPGGVRVPLADWRAVGALWRVAVAYLLFAGGYIAYITFLSAYLTAHHASVTQVAVTWAVLGLAAIAQPALWSRPLHAWAGARTLAAALAGLSAAATVAIISAAPAVVIVSAIGYGVSFLVVPAAVTSLVHAAVPRPNWTAALASFTVVFAVGQMVGPYLAGVLADSYGAGATLVWTAALCAAGSVASLTVRPARKG